jgi:hypothetical protein
MGGPWRTSSQRLGEGRGIALGPRGEAPFPTQLSEVTPVTAFPDNPLGVTEQQVRDRTIQGHLGVDGYAVVGRHHTDSLSIRSGGEARQPVLGGLESREANAGVVDGLVGAVLDPGDLAHVVVPGTDVASLGPTFPEELSLMEVLLARALVVEGYERDGDGQEGTEGGDGVPVRVDGDAVLPPLG